MASLRESALGVYLLILAVVVLVGGFGWFLIYARRKRWPDRWPRPLRWAFVAFVWTLAGLGAVTWFGVWAERWGWMTAAWLIGFPFAFHLWEALPPRGPSSTTE